MEKEYFLMKIHYFQVILITKFLLASKCFPIATWNFDLDNMP